MEDEMPALAQLLLSQQNGSSHATAELALLPPADSIDESHLWSVHSTSELVEMLYQMCFFAVGAPLNAIALRNFYKKSVKSCIFMRVIIREIFFYIMIFPIQTLKSPFRRNPADPPLPTAVDRPFDGRCLKEKNIFSSLKLILILINKILFDCCQPIIINTINTTLFAQVLCIYCLWRTHWIWNIHWTLGNPMCKFYSFLSALPFHLWSNMVAAIAIDMLYCIKSANNILKIYIIQVGIVGIFSFHVIQCQMEQVWVKSAKHFLLCVVNALFLLAQFAISHPIILQKLKCITNVQKYVQQMRDFCQFGDGIAEIIRRPQLAALFPFFGLFPTQPTN
jgi:hypothetical protein